MAGRRDQILSPHYEPAQCCPFILSLQVFSDFGVVIKRADYKNRGRVSKSSGVFLAHDFCGILLARSFLSLPL